MRQLGNGLAFLYHGLTLGTHQIAGVALLSTGGILLAHQLGGVRQLGNGLAFLYHGLTLGAHQIAGVALLGAGGIFLVLQLGLVLGQGQLGLFLADLGLGLSVGEVLVALGAVPVVDVALDGASGGFGRNGG